MPTGVVERERAVGADRLAGQLFDEDDALATGLPSSDPRRGL
jgi:hypothetical protein